MKTLPKLGTVVRYIGDSTYLQGIVGTVDAIITDHSYEYLIQIHISPDTVPADFPYDKAYCRVEPWEIEPIHTEQQ